MSITYRMLPLDEWDKLTPLYTKTFPGLPIPRPEMACACVAENEDQVVGFWFMQLCAHGEPAAIDPEYSGEVSLHKLLETLHKACQEGGAAGMSYYVYTATPEWDQPLQEAGFRPIGLAYNNIVPVEEKD